MVLGLSSPKITVNNERRLRSKPFENLTKLVSRFYYLTDLGPLYGHVVGQELEGITWWMTRSGGG